MSQTSWFAIRGPVLLFGVAVSVVLPILASLSNTARIQLALAFWGILLLFNDVIRLVESKLRGNMHKWLDGMVLDNVLRAIHDPETGVIACAIGSFLGAHSMYALRMNEQQRTKLVQASLQTSEAEARTILLEPGGVQNLLPKSALDWLHEGNSGTSGSVPLNHSLVKPRAIHFEDSSSDTSLSDSVAKMMNDDDVSVNSHSAPGSVPASPGSTAEDGNQKTRQKCRTQPHMPQHSPMDPLAIMFSIIKELLRDQIRPYIDGIPESTMETLGASAAVALVVQGVLRRKSRTSLLGTTSALTLTGVSLGAFSFVLARHAVLGNIHNMESIRSVGRQSILRVWHKVKQKAAMDGRWRGFVAMLVLLLVGKAQRRDRKSEL